MIIASSEMATCHQHRHYKPTHTIKFKELKNSNSSHHRIMHSENIRNGNVPSTSPLQANERCKNSNDYTIKINKPSNTTIKLN